MNPKRRRGKRKVKTKLSIYHLNINGFKSKSDSLKNIVAELKPDVLVLNEVKSVSSSMLRKYFNELGYEIILRKEGGMVIAARPHLKLMNVTTTSHPNILAGRIMTKEMDMVVIGAYGIQETENLDDRKAFYDELSIEVESSNTHSIIVGDLNAKIEYGEGNVTGTSSSGKLLEDLILKYSFKAVNFHPKCSGKWKRVQKKGDNTEKQ